MSFEYGEDLLQFIWQYQLYEQKDLVTTKGQKIQIVNQGCLNQNSGPDFENVTIKLNGVSFFGAIEIHIDSNSWKTHRHHKDKAYNNVVLHVCFSESAVAHREDGTEIPLLLLQHRINDSSLANYSGLMTSQSFIPCENQINKVKKLDINNWLERLIVERLEDRSEKFSKYLRDSENNWNQAFYISIVRCFGMPINSECFEEIGEYLPYDVVLKHSKSIFQLEALLLGTASLLEEKYTDTYYLGLQMEYGFLKAKCRLQCIPSQLKFGRMRPRNLPHIKLAQLAALYHHIPNFCQMVLDFPDIKKIKKLLQFDLSLYWNTHYSFGKESKEQKKNISPSFINHLFLNAIIPFTFHYQKIKMDQNGEIALSYLEELPSEKNSIISNWDSIGIKSNNALNSQSLLHLYKHYCQPKKCLNCNIGRTILVKSQ